ncbi:MAG TPA: hypothetical protein VNW92_02435 [Polyangiaceae bacterium]|jgi:hypothetical protein|nr:hypothetical protein [Polyangiaceae bacterium]
MSVTSISTLTARRTRALAVSVCLGATQLLPGCAVFGGGGPSLVAQGKYYSSGNPQYDEFFIALYQLQVEMAGAPSAVDAERQNLAQALGLSPETPADGLAQRLREEALKLSRTGLRMKLEQNASLDKPEAASANIVATYRPKDNAAASLISKVETSATVLLRTDSQMKAAETLLAKLEVQSINLDADVPKAFAEARVGKQGEVKKNLADAQKLITLMKARGDDVHTQSEQLLTAVSKAVNTDDGALSAPPPVAPETKAPDAAPKPHAKAKAASGAPASSAPAPAAKPKPPKPAAGDDEAPAKPAPSKPAPPPRDFEP